MKRTVSFILIIVMMFSQLAYAEESAFSDMATDHWAYDAVMTMSDLGIISGYSDGTFKPNNPITRAEFATVMVLALDLEINPNATSTFVDMADSHWVVPYVDASKQYLTGYSTSTGTKFKPDDNAVREDMAVAIVKARSLDVSSADESYLNAYNDENNIDGNLRKYVGAAIKHGIMIGSVEGDKKVFNPKDVLTRAEAAVLLLKIVDTDEEKIVLDESELKLTVSELDNGLLMNWSVSNKEGLKGFKVVASKQDNTPIYPENGYVKYISNTTQREILLSGKLENHNGDTDYLLPGESYNFSITALYDSGNMASNTVYAKYTESDCDTTSVHLEGAMNNGVAVLEWSADECDNISGFKVVASKSDGTPIYPENGYYTYLAGNYHERIEIAVGSYYKNGDFERFETNETYYFSITALVGDQKIASNTVSMKFDGLDEIEEPGVELFGVEKGNSIVLEWSDYNDAYITGFKVVASNSDGSPIYPEDGYFKYIQKGQDQRVVINVNDYYNGGDIEKFKAGEDYYFSITALVGDRKIASNTLTLGFDEAAVVTPPQVTLEGRADGRYMFLEWMSYNDHNVEGFKVVASKSDSSPKYPENGYYKYIRIGSEENVVIEVGSSYNNGDFEKFEAGETYYFSITTIYSGGKEASNTIKLTFED